RKCVSCLLIFQKR
ncbi:PHP domain protein, partial [Vibrio parahaemolyticus V-223/04]